MLRRTVCFPYSCLQAWLRIPGRYQTTPSLPQVFLSLFRASSLKGKDRIFPFEVKYLVLDGQSVCRGFSLLLHTLRHLHSCLLPPYNKQHYFYLLKLSLQKIRLPFYIASFQHTYRLIQRRNSYY